jgi:hypothetical protein
MPIFQVDWTEYRSTVVKAKDYAEAHEKVHNTEEYDHDNSLVDMSTTDIVNLTDKHNELAADRLASKRAISDRDAVELDDFYSKKADWQVTFWDAKDNILETYFIDNRTEQEASKEAESEADRYSHHTAYDTWTLRKVKNNE